MAYERRDFGGGAIETTITAGINSTATSISIASATGWPDGADGKFLVEIGPGTSSAEKVLVQSRSGTTLTVASSGDRGSDGTSATSHSSGATIRHVMGAIDADEANYAVAQTVGKVTTKGDVVVATGANAFGRLAVGSTGKRLEADSGETTGWNWSGVRVCRVYRSTDQSIPTATDTAVSWDAEASDAGGMHVGGAPTRVVLNKVGWWLIRAQVTFTANGAGVRATAVAVNGAVISSASGTPQGVNSHVQEVTDVVLSSAITDYAEILAYQNTGGGLDVLGGSSTTVMVATFLGVAE